MNRPTPTLRVRRVDVPMRHEPAVRPKRPARHGLCDVGHAEPVRSAAQLCEGCKGPPPAVRRLSKPQVRAVPGEFGRPRGAFGALPRPLAPQLPPPPPGLRPVVRRVLEGAAAGTRGRGSGAGPTRHPARPEGKLPFRSAGAPGMGGVRTAASVRSSGGPVDGVPARGPPRPVRRSCGGVRCGSRCAPERVFRGGTLTRRGVGASEPRVFLGARVPRASLESGAPGARGPGHPRTSVRVPRAGPAYVTSPPRTYAHSREVPGRRGGVPIRRAARARTRSVRPPHGEPVVRGARAVREARPPHGARPHEGARRTGSPPHGGAGEGNSPVRPQVVNRTPCRRFCLLRMPVSYLTVTVT